MHDVNNRENFLTGDDLTYYIIRYLKEMEICQYPQSLVSMSSSELPQSGISWSYRTESIHDINTLGMEILRWCFTKVIVSY